MLEHENLKRVDVRHNAVRHLALAACRAALDLLLPIQCVACERPVPATEKGIVCGRCWSRLDLIPAPRCLRCGHPLSPGTCRWCDLLPPWVRAVRSCCWVPGEPAGQVVHALKYEGWTRVAQEMARRMARLSWPVDVVEERAALVAVPLHPTRLRERGFNQSALLAEALAEAWAIPAYPNLLVRTRATQTQTRLTPGERHRNVSGCFRADAAAIAPLRGAHLVLVDDVVTTAATLNACAEALLAGGARIVSYVTFGRAHA